ncbi:MAG TPA: class I SAM-dependent methyltransferase [Ktedonobacteraceae bacterium]|jgi:SAM-dependent methyltransferase|nr:class I SAM-dependent methyltransferase [Ktedonobacteraceae bacterium]
MPAETPDNSSGYIFDSESAAEMARLMKQDRILTRGMGGIFPPHVDISDVRDILDIACGPGGWALDVAHAYRDKQVVGIDISKLVIQYARAQAKVQWADNASFKIMDIRQPFAFEDNSFDLINARLLFGVLPRTAWPNMLQECLRINRPGGLIRLTESELPLTNSPAFELLASKFAEALYKGGHSFSVDGRHIGITPVLGHLLRAAGYQRVRTEGYIIDCSAGAEAYESCYENFEIGLRLAQPLIVDKFKLMKAEDFEETYQRVLLEMGSSDFCGTWPLLSAWGEKP